MPFTFSDDDFDRLAAAFGVEPKRDGPVVRFEMKDAESGRRLVLEIQPEVALPDGLADAETPTGLVSVYGMNAFLQLQGCTGFIASEELGEAIFFARKHDTHERPRRRARRGLLALRERGRPAAEGGLHPAPLGDHDELRRPLDDGDALRGPALVRAGGEEQP